MFTCVDWLLSAAHVRRAWRGSRGRTRPQECFKLYATVARAGSPAFMGGFSSPIHTAEKSGAFHSVANCP